LAIKEAAGIVEDFKKAHPNATVYSQPPTWQNQNANEHRIPKVTAHYCDVSSEDFVSKAIAEVIAEHGHIDGLVTSAGFTETIPALTYPIERMRRLFAVNLDGTYLFAVAIAKHLIERKAKGSMVFIGSMSGAIVNLPQRQTPYNVSKAAVRHLAASLAVEWATEGIRVNCISPGYMTTPLWVYIPFTEGYVSSRTEVLTRK